MIRDTEHREAHTFFNMGNVCRGENRVEDAIVCYERAVSLQPVYAEAYNNMGLAFQDKGDLDASIRCFQRAIDSNPNLFHAYFNMGVSFESRGAMDDAIFCFQNALLLKPDLSAAYNRLGNIFREEGRLDKAVVCFQKEIEIDPGNAQAYNNLGSVLHDMGAVTEAIECFGTSLGLRPDHVETHWNLALAHLLTGNYLEGWRGYEYRFMRGSHQPTFPEVQGIPRWDGSSFTGKRLLVHGEQGFGDNLQFVRYLPMVKNRGGTTVLHVNKPLRNLFRGIEGVDDMAEGLSNGMPAVDVDLYIPIMSLPSIFGTTLETIPSGIPYLRADPESERYWRERLDRGSFGVGVVWAGNPGHKNDRKRSCPLKLFEPISRMPGISLYGLRKSGADTLQDMHGIPRLTHLGEALNDFSVTAGIVANLDLIISVDTAVAHLAGAMGRPVWLLLPFVPDWRWLLKRDDSPWYPTMRIFRQARPGDWAGVFEHVYLELASLLSTREGT